MTDNLLEKINLAFNTHDVLNELLPLTGFLNNYELWLKTALKQNLITNDEYFLVLWYIRIGKS
jgi:hypothetical protein